MPVQTRGRVRRRLDHLTTSAPTALSKLPHLGPDQFNVTSRIEDGAFGSVARGTWQGHVVAIKKVLNPRDKGEEADFRKECTLLASLPLHPSILRPNAVCFEYPTFAVLTPYYPDGTVRDWTPASLTEVLACMTDLAEALDHLHRHGILHRDVKPSNVLKHGTRFILADFGLACRTVSLMEHRYTYGWIGTPGYMAPEVVGRRPYGFPCDIYAVGVVFAYLLRAWRCPNHVEPNVSTKRSEIQVMDGVRPSVPYDLIPPPVGRLVDACWATNPMQRPRAGSLARTLKTLRGWLDVPRTLRWTTMTTRLSGKKRTRVASDHGV